jgi:hypothetical protein
LKKAPALFFFFLLPFIGFGQKFMINGKDTLPYKEKMVIQSGDTTYEGACRTFEKINGQIVNQSDSVCLRQGVWIVRDSMGNCWRGNYMDGSKTGLWRRFNKNGKLLREREEAHFDRDTYLVKDVDYSTGHPRIIVNKPFFAFYIHHLIAIMVVVFTAFFFRIFINSTIYNVENGTDYSPIYFFAAGYVSRNFYHSLICTFTLWFFDYKPQNKLRVQISHILSIVSVGIFLIIIIGLGIGGELN